MPKTEERRAVAIAPCGDAIAVLCTDGSIWWLDSVSHVWKSLPPIPGIQT